MKWTGLNSVQSWGVAVLCGLVNFLVFIPIRLSGLLFVEVVAKFGTDRRSASFPIILYSVIRCALGSFAAYFAEFWGLRYTIACGSFVASIGMAASFLVEDLTALTIAWGIIFGAGFTMSNTLLPHVIKQHFDKNVTNANGITFTGISIGAFVIPPLAYFFFDKYGFAGGMLLIGGIMLNAVPAALLLFEPSKHNTRLISKCSDVDGKDVPEAGSLLLSPKNSEENGKEHSFIKDFSSQETTPASSHAVSFSNGNNTSESQSDSALSSTVVGSTAEETRFQGKNAETLNKNSSEANGSAGDTKETKWMYIKSNDPDNDKNHVDSSEQESISLHPISACRDGNVAIVQRGNGSKRGSNRHREVVKSLAVFVDPVYLLILTSHGILSFLNVVVWTVMVDASRDKGIPYDQEVYILMLMPLSELVGFLGFGWVTDRKFVSHLHYAGICFTFAGVFCACMAWSNGFGTYLGAVLGFALCISAVGITYPALIIKFVDESQQSMAIASRNLIFAPLSFSVSPMIGYFKDNLGSYDWVLYICTIASVTACSLVQMVPLALKMRQNKKRKSAEAFL